MEQLAPETSRSLAFQAVDAHKPFNHVDNHVAEGAATKDDRDDGPVGVAAEGALGAGNPRWGSEGGDVETGGAGGGTQSSRRLGELDRR